MSASGTSSTWPWLWEIAAFTIAPHIAIEEPPVPPVPVPPVPAPPVDDPPPVLPLVLVADDEVALPPPPPGPVVPELELEPLSVPDSSSPQPSAKTTLAPASLRNS